MESYEVFRNLVKINIEQFFFEYEDEKRNVLDLFLRLINENESNSALLIGPPRSGKTQLIESVLFDIKSQLSGVLMISLDGMIQTDDKQAVKTITRQLKMDTMDEEKHFDSVAENLYYLISCLKKVKQVHRLIFIIDNFELFCSHHNQQLLYGLFDVVQSALFPVCVLGVSSRYDVVEMLEKRVKSRFSHRQIFIDPASDDHFDTYVNNFKKVLNVPDSVHKKASKWNRQIETICQDDKCLRALKQYFQVDATYSILKLLVFCLISDLTHDHPQITADDVVKHVKELIMAEDKVHLIADLSVLELCLLIAIKHHCDIYDNDPFNFEIILSRLNKFSVKSSSMQNLPRESVLKCFENLKYLEFISPIGSEGRVQKEYQMYRLSLFADQINSAIKIYRNLPTDIDQWSKSSLI